MGHHTPPARAMPNTQAKAVASLLDSTATLSPAAMPPACNARPTQWLMRCTSP
jgi:pyrroline-5-carboxylate reductase